MRMRGRIAVNFREEIQINLIHVTKITETPKLIHVLIKYKNVYYGVFIYNTRK